MLWHDVDFCAGGLKMYDGGLHLCVIELDTTLGYYYSSSYYYYCYYYYYYYYYYYQRHEF